MANRPIQQAESTETAVNAYLEGLKYGKAGGNIKAQMEPGPEPAPNPLPAFAPNIGVVLKLFSHIQSKGPVTAGDLWRESGTALDEFTVALFSLAESEQVSFETPVLFDTMLRAGPGE
jgi:hypothetical protein